MKTIISIFAGCGGSSLGYKLAGFKELLAIDFDKNAEETFKSNFPEIPFWNKVMQEVELQLERSIALITIEKLPLEWEAK